MNWLPKRWALLLACVAVLTFIVILGRTENGKAYTKTSWEYKVVSESGMVNLERSLNQLGIDGWELVSFTRSDGLTELQGTWIFKRSK